MPDPTAIETAIDARAAALLATAYTAFRTRINDALQALASEIGVTGDDLAKFVVSEEMTGETAHELLTAAAGAGYEGENQGANTSGWPTDLKSYRITAMTGQLVTAAENLGIPVEEGA